MTDNKWRPIETAPWGKVIEVKNDAMERPCLATRGYIHNGMVHEDRTFFTTVYTSDRFFPIPAGNLVLPNVWRYPEHD